MKTTTILSIVIIIALVLGSYFFGYKSGSKPVEYRSDTITITDLDTFTLVKPIPYMIKVDSIIYDTLFNVDSIPVLVQVPLSKYEFADTLFKDSTSVELYQTLIGYRVSIEKTTMKLKSTSTVVYPVQVPTNKKHWSIGPSFGATFYNGKIIPTVGISLTYKIFEL